MDRRGFVKAATFGAVAAGLGVPKLAAGPAQAAPPINIRTGNYERLVPEIFRPSPTAPQHSRALVIGSGFGGAVAALRLGQAGIQTTVLERGSRWPHDRWRQIFAGTEVGDGRALWHYAGLWPQLPGGFPLKGIPVGPIGPLGPIPQIGPVEDFGGVLEARWHNNMLVLAGAGVGGGSLVYTAVTNKPTKRLFDAAFEGLVDFESMESQWYPKVQAILKASPMPADILASPNFGHNRKFMELASKAGFTVERPVGNWNWDIVRDEIAGRARKSATIGETNNGVSNGAKNDLSQNYIPLAEATGNVTVCSGHQVHSIHYSARTKRYTVRTDVTNPWGDVLRTRELTCDQLFLAAGSMGTTELLMRARARKTLPNLNEHVGTGWGGNGDVLSGQWFIPFEGQKLAAPIGVGVYDESGLPTRMLPFSNEIIRETGPYFTCGAEVVDDARGSFTYHPQLDRSILNFPAGGNDDARAAVRAIHDRLANAGAGFVFPDALSLLPNLTVHPLGGAVIGKVTDSYGRVKGYDGLYVLDSAAMPGTAAGANPSFTVAALAERNIAEIISAGR